MKTSKRRTPRPPFKMLPNRTAQARYTWTDSHGKQHNSLHSGRAHFIWYQYVLIPLACGVTNEVEIRTSLGRDRGPWHKVRFTPDEAQAWIEDGYPLARVKARRLIASQRAKRGLPKFQRDSGARGTTRPEQS
jgi:hypothetical protein